jgi:hypothetical protein
MRSERSKLDILIVSLGSTSGWQTSDQELLSALERVGARAALVAGPAPRAVRTFMATDLLWARSAKGSTRAR